MKITLWVPAAEQPRWPCVMSWWNMETPDGKRMEIVPGRVVANNIKYSWNDTLKKFLDTDSDYILSMHNDVVAAPKTLMRLLSWDKPLVSALIFMREDPVAPHIWRKRSNTDKYNLRIQDTFRWLMEHKAINFGPFVMEPRPDDALAEIDFTSTSCTLIHRSVLEKMRERVQDMWFKWDDDLLGRGEDRNFFSNASEVGFQAYVDRSCIVGHLVGDIPMSSADFVAWCSATSFMDDNKVYPQ